MRFSICAVVVLVSLLLADRSTATADPVLNWNAIAVRTVSSQNPFFQARFMAITQLAVFEAVNAVEGRYESYTGAITGDRNASADAAAIAAAHRVLVSFNLAGTASQLDADRASALAAIPDGAAKTAGIALGDAAALEMIRIRTGDGAAPMPVHLPSSALAGEW